MSIRLPLLLPPLPLPFFFQTFLLGSHYIAHTVVLPQPLLYWIRGVPYII